MRETEFAGQSLRFVRQLLRCPAKWPTAKSAAKILPLVVDEELPLAAVCFYGVEPWGHCGLYVNDGVCLTVNSDGLTRLLPYDDEHYWGGPFIGWVSAETFALYSGAKDIDI